MKKKIIRLTEEDLVRIVKKVVSEQDSKIRGIRRYDGKYFVNGAKTESEKDKSLSDGIARIKSYKNMVETNKLPLDNGSQKVYCIWTGGYMVVYKDDNYSPESFVGAVAVDGYPHGHSGRPNEDNRISSGYAELPFIFADGLVDKYTFPVIGLDVTKCKYFVSQKEEK